LDGTLLNHGDYRFDDAQTALHAIRFHAYPLILVSSKTAEEIREFQRMLGLRDPFICENGGAVHYPKGYPGFDGGSDAGDGFDALILGAKYRELTDFLAPFKKPLGIRGFADMDVAEIAERTGLSLQDALLAKKRRYTEPFVITDEKRLPLLIPEAHKAGLSITKGGRFYHLKKANSDKGVAVRAVTARFAAHLSYPPLTFALGDGENDREMLEAVETPLVVRRPDGSCLEGFSRCSEHPGAKGWNELIMGVLFG
jgi:mannosyl-3-phosphoglycerate phosphatase